MGELPYFKYHPDPIGTGMIERSEVVCECCGQARGYVYTGAVYCVDDVEDVCPWCIADGSAHTKFGASFTDAAGIPGVSGDVVREVAYRTPGFSGWQQEQWWTHCGDAAQYLGRAGRAELEGLGPETLRILQEFCRMDDDEWSDVLAVMEKDGSPVTYLFSCSKCGQVGGYWDCD